MKKDKMPKVAFIGMTHLGLIHAVAFAEKGFSICGFDDNSDLIDKLNDFQVPVNEPYLNELLLKNKQRLYFTTHLEDLLDYDVVYIAYDVPTDSHGHSDLSIINDYIQKISQYLHEDASLVVLSQVPPGFTRQIQRRKDRLFYQVETLVFGQAINRALYPERYMVGADHSNQNLPESYQCILNTFECPILKMKYESAELAKISINMFLVSSVITTNTIAELCEKMGADWDEIAPSLRLDKRIGQHAYLSPGLGISGGNLERDLTTFIKLGHYYHTDVDTVESWVSNSKYRKNWVWNCLQEYVLPAMNHPKIAILGLAYKPNTHSVKNSPSLTLIEHLNNHNVHAHDPIVRDTHGTCIQLHQDINDTVKDADVLIVMIPCEEYKQLDMHQILDLMKGKIIIDPFQTLKLVSNSSKEYSYFCLGKPAIKVSHQESTYA